MANATITVLEADGVTQTDAIVLGVGRQAEAASKSIALATEDKAVLDAVAASVDGVEGLLTTIDSDTSRLTSSATNIAAGSALATTSFVVGSRYLSTPPTFTNGQEGALQIDSAGRLIVNVGAGSGGAVTVADGADVTLGAQADAASATTTISAKLRGIATALGITALDLGTGTAGSRTLRFFKDTAQWIGGAGAVTSATQRTTLASDDPAVASLAKFSTGKYIAVAASQTDSVIQLSSGAAGDYLDHVIVVPATTAPGVVTIKDNATALISYPGGGTTALLTLTPFTIYVGAVSSSGAWKITTGANVSILAVGKFS